MSKCVRPVGLLVGSLLLAFSGVGCGGSVVGTDARTSLDVRDLGTLADATAKPPLGCSAGTAPTCKELALTSPQNYQVFQRDASGMGSVQVSGAFSDAGTVVRVVAQLASSGATVADQSFKVDRSAGQTTFAVSLPLAGAGWYHFWVQELPADEASVLAEGSVAQAGVGEVFLTAGQSNSVAAGEKPQSGSALTSAALLDIAQNRVTWFADIDPPTSTGGTPWPIFAARLSATLGMPVAVMQVGCGGTDLLQWLPPGAQGAKSATWCGSDATSPGRSTGGW